MKFPESQLAHKYLDGLSGLEIGGSAHNAFGLKTLNVDYTDSMDTVFKQAEVQLCGEAMKVDIVSKDDKIPVKNNSQDFIISSHVIEHIFDPIGALLEWFRVTKRGGYIFSIVPITSCVPGETRPTTTLQELIDRHSGKIKQTEILNKIVKDNDGILGEAIINGILYDTKHGHWTIFDTDLFREICDYLKFEIVELLEVDDKVGNGFCVIIKK